MGERGLGRLSLRGLRRLWWTLITVAAVLILCHLALLIAGFNNPWIPVLGIVASACLIVVSFVNLRIERSNKRHKNRDDE